MTDFLIPGKVYKIISDRSARVLTLTDSGLIQACSDKNANTQKWRANLIQGELWALKCLHQPEGEGVYLSWAGTEPQKNPLLVGLPDRREWNISQWNTRGGAEHRIWVPGATKEYLVDLKGADLSNNAPIWLWQTNDNAAQFWLFQEQ